MTKLFKVTIQFNENVSKELIDNIISKNFYEENVSLENEKIVTIEWSIPKEEGAYEIENELFYILDAGKYGTYTCELLVRKEG